VCGPADLGHIDLTSTATPPQVPDPGRAGRWTPNPGPAKGVTSLRVAFVRRPKATPHSTN